MKFEHEEGRSGVHVVAPFAGAWIEILKEKILYLCIIVAPFAGAWIEIPGSRKAPQLSHVAPFAGAWIEIHPDKKSEIESPSRSLRGSVD